MADNYEGVAPPSIHNDPPSPWEGRLCAQSDGRAVSALRGGLKCGHHTDTNSYASGVAALMSYKLMILFVLLVGAPGLEPGTR